MCIFLLQYKIYKHKKIIILYLCFIIKSNIFVILGLRQDYLTISQQASSHELGFSLETLEKK